MTIMAAKYTILKVVCLSLCLVVKSSADEESTLDFIEHVLKIPNSEKVLNTVLGRLEKGRQRARSSDRALADEADCNDSLENLPEYTESVQISRERELRQLDIMKYYPICHTERKIKRLNTNEFEYRPAYYEEVRCSSAPIEDLDVSNEICSSLGFSCVQWNKTIHLTRRRYSSDCWETRTMVIPAGCECMWPFHRLGDIKLHV